MVLIKPLLSKAIYLYFSVFVFLATNFTPKSILGEVIIFGLFDTFDKIYKKCFWVKIV